MPPEPDRLRIGRESQSGGEVGSMKERTSDYHVHSSISPDGKGTMEEMCRAAIAGGIAELVFTDHYEFYAFGVTRPFFNKAYVEKYFAKLSQCRAMFQGQIMIKSGMEFGQLHLDMERADRIIKSWPFDYLIGSIHKIDNVDLSQMAFTPETVKGIGDAYYKHLLELAQTGDFDCLGHLDLYKRHCSKAGLSDSYERYEDIIGEILKVLIRRKKGIEINTSGLRQGAGETMPGLRCLRLYKELGGRIITIGSDAHRPEDVGADVKEAFRLMKKAGFQQCARYEERNVMEALIF